MLSCSCTAATKLNTTAVRFFFPFFQSELFIWFFVQDPKGFIGGCVCNSSFRLLRQTKRKIFLHFALPLPPQNEMQLLSGFSCYSNLVCLFGFWVEKRVATCSSKVKVEHAHLVAFRSCTNLVPRVSRLFGQRGNAWKMEDSGHLKSQPHKSCGSGCSAHY